MNMEELHKTLIQAQEEKEARLNESKVIAENKRREELKDVQQKFINHFVKLVEDKATEIIQDRDYSKKYVDVLTFSLPPKDTNKHNVDFEGHLLIELMEGPKDCNYLEHFEASGTEPTIELLKKACAPLKVHYGYYYKVGNVIQIRWDANVPGWALSEPEHFESKKAASRKNKQDRQNQRNHKGRSNPNPNHLKSEVGLKNPFEMADRIQGLYRPRPNKPFNNNERYNNNERFQHGQRFNNNQRYNNSERYNNNEMYNNTERNNNTERYNNGGRYNNGRHNNTRFNNQVRQKGPNNRQYSRRPRAPKPDALEDHPSLAEVITTPTEHVEAPNEVQTTYDETE
jgi:hypothetical protein